MLRSRSYTMPIEIFYGLKRNCQLETIPLERFSCYEFWVYFAVISGGLKRKKHRKKTTTAAVYCVCCVPKTEMIERENEKKEKIESTE